MLLLFFFIMLALYSVRKVLKRSVRTFIDHAYLHLPVRVLKKNPKKNVVFWHQKSSILSSKVEDAGIDILNLFDVIFVFGVFLRFSSKRSLFVNFWLASRKFC